MATLIQNADRAEGTGLEGQGPDINLPSTGASNPLRITVNPTKEAAPVQEPVVTPQAQVEAPVAFVEEKLNPAWSQINEALSSGYSRAEVAQYLQETQKLSPEDADLQVIESVRAKVKRAKAEGYSDAEVKDFLITSRYDGSVIDSAMANLDKPKPWKKYEWDPSTPAEEVKDVADLYHNIYDKYSNLGKQVVGVFDEQQGIEARRDINAINASIAQKMSEKGYKTSINPTTGDLMYEDDNGTLQEVDSGFLNGVFNSKGELAGAISGGIAGLKLGLEAPGRSKLVAAPVLGVLGSAAGAMAGRGADLALNSYMLKEKLEIELYKKQMVEAGIFDGVTSVLGAGAFKLLGTGAKGVMKAWDLVVAGNSKGAYKALLDNMLIDETQATELVAQWEKLNQKAAPGRTAQEKAISVITTTKQGGEVFLQPSVGNDPKLANTIVADVSARAKSIYKAIGTVGTDNIGKVLREDLTNYKKDVKEFYGLVRGEGTQAVDGTDFRFDFDKLAIDPVMQSIGRKIADPRMQERFIAYSQRMQNASADRTFSGLLDLRQAVNDFKYSIKKMSPNDEKAINGVINRIDGQISKAAKDYIPNHKDWLENFTKAKTEYAKMKVLEKNVLYQALVKKGVTNKEIKKAISDKINSLDGTFDEVLEKLPPAARAKTEAAIIEAMTDKFTIGNKTDIQATHLPMLADALNQLDIKTPEAKRLVGTINEMSKVFKNDVNLGQLSGKLTVPQFQSYLTADPVLRAKFEVASQSFKWIRRMAPTKEGNNLALVKKVSRLLENPLNAKTADEFIAGMPKESREEMRSLVKELQLQWGKQEVKPASDFVNMYKRSANGNLAVSDGALGKGIYLFNKVSAGADGSAKVIKHEVNMSRMATLKDISDLVGREVTEKDIRTIPGIQDTLRDANYLGINLGDKAMLFPEKVIGSKTVTKPVEKTTEYTLFHTSGEQALKASDFKDKGGFSYFSTDREYVDALGGVYEGEKNITNTYTSNADLIDALKDKDFQAFIAEKVGEDIEAMNKAEIEKLMVNNLTGNTLGAEVSIKDLKQYLSTKNKQGLKIGSEILLNQKDINKVLKEKQVASIPEKGFTKAFNIKIDVPSEQWLLGKQKTALQDIAEGRNGIRGSVTGYFDTPIKINTDVLNTLKGANGEENYRYKDIKYLNLRKQIEKEGYKDAENTILVRVNHLGEPFIVEGNHRVVIAKEKGIKDLSVKLEYMNGAERVDGILSPSKLKNK